MKPPLLSSPVALSGAPIPSGAVKTGGGLVLGAVVGAVAAWIVPKVLDRLATPMLDPHHGEPVTLEYDDGP